MVRPDPFRPRPLAALRPPGISELFAGVSGTGKTLAAEVLAKELHLDLNRIDLSALVWSASGRRKRGQALGLGVYRDWDGCPKPQDLGLPRFRGQCFWGD